MKGRSTVIAAGRRVLLDTRECWICDVLLRVAVSLTLSLAVLLVLLVLGAPNLADRSSPQIMEPGFGTLLFVSIFGPLVENALLVLLMRLLNRLRSNALTVMLASGVIAALHTFEGWERAIIVFPAFIVFALTYRAYRPRRGLGYLTSCAVHGLDNAVIWSVMAIETAQLSS